MRGVVIAMSVLETVTGPADVRGLPSSALPGLAAEIRALLIDSVPRTSGHLAPTSGLSS
jgi:1-deoxy-D-xylulose-5-phosphate synthase